MSNQEIIKNLRANLEASVKKVLKFAVNLTEFETKDGDTIYSDTPELTEGVSNIYSEDANNNPTPAEDGDYELTTGQTITVSNGSLSSISGDSTTSDTNSPDTEMADATATETAPTDPDASNDADLESRVTNLEGLVTQILSVLKTSMKTNDTLLSANEVLKTKVETLSKSPAKEAIKTKKTFLNSDKSELDKINEYSNKFRAK